MNEAPGIGHTSAVGKPQRDGGTLKAGTAGQRWHGIAIPTLVALVVLVVSWGRPLTDDVAWYLISTRDWLGGAALYERIVEVNTPINFYFTVPAILVADALGLSDTNGQYVLATTLIFASLVWCGAIMRAEFGMSPLRRAVLLAGVAAAMVIPALDSIGQREHTFVLLMMPWLLGQAAPRPPGVRSELLRALVAALGVCVKPHFVLFPMAVTLVRMAQARSLKPILSPANLTFLGVGLAYVSYVALVHPAYLFEIVPIGEQVYGAYRAEAGTVLMAAYPKVLLLLLPVLMAVIGRQVVTVPWVFVAATLAGLACYLMQWTAFAYHLIPLTSFGLVACVLLLVQARKLTPFVAASAAAAAGLMVMGVRQGYPQNSAVADLAAVRDQVGEFSSIIALSSSPFAGPPVAMAANAEWVSRYPANWLVPGAITALSTTDCAAQPETCAKLRSIAAKNRTENIIDMERAEPDLLIVDRNSGYFPAPRFDWLAFMDEDPGWKAVFSQYREVASTERFVYFRRQP